MSRIVDRDVQRIRTCVHGSHTGERPMLRDRDGDRAATRSKIQYSCRLMLWKPLQCLFYEQFRIRARNKNSGCDFEVKAIKFPFARDVGDWLAVFSSRDVGTKSIPLGGTQYSLGMGGEMGAIGP